MPSNVWLIIFLMIPTQKIQTFLNGNLLLYVPDLPLSQFVNHIWYVKECCTRNKSVERFLPNASMDLIINLGDEPEKILGIDANDQNLKRCWISGLHAKYIRIETPPRMCMMGVEFKAGSAYPFFGFPMSELTGSTVELDLIWGRDPMDARDAILESISDEEKFRIVENLLLRKLKANPTLPPVIVNAMNLILTTYPVPKIRTVADRLGVEHKRLISQFEGIVGITPKLFSRICRFQRALHTIAGNGHANLTTVAVSCDYYDQAHFIKEFEEFSGLAPREYLLRKGLSFPGWISESEVVALR
ncbi:helix-turn-helix domain-containing protein [bacterium]|nr:helix-turn-helix domain-containing protein [bacterium]MCI0611967.1 helix-turn-helix domain-containing protein [bacterium]